jgi:hypothetical protein
MTAVIGGAVVAELLVARTKDPVRARTQPVVPIDELEDSGPIDELDDADSDPHEGPIYRDEPPGAPGAPPAGGSK